MPSNHLPAGPPSNATHGSYQQSTPLPPTQHIPSSQAATSCYAGQQPFPHMNKSVQPQPNLPMPNGLPPPPGHTNPSDSMPTDHGQGSAQAAYIPRDPASPPHTALQHRIAADTWQHPSRGSEAQISTAPPPCSWSTNHVSTSNAPMVNNVGSPITGFPSSDLDPRGGRQIPSPLYPPPISQSQPSTQHPVQNGQYGSTYPHSMVPSVTNSPHQPSGVYVPSVSTNETKTNVGNFPPVPPSYDLPQMSQPPGPPMNTAPHLPSYSSSSFGGPSQSYARTQQLQSPAYPRRSTGASTFRTPGNATTLAEWNQIKTPIGLLQDYQLWPSDTPDIPPAPAVPYPVNCDPDIMRCTLNNMPATSKLLRQSRLPLGLVIHPFKDLANLHTIQSSVIVRCRSCRAYINPFVQFVDGGRRWRCPVCFLANTVPDDFLFDPVSRSYGDPSRRPEIRCATVEFIAPQEYMLRPPQPATYLFCFDVTHNALATGYLRLVCERLAASLDRLPGDCRAQIGFISFDSAVHFYKFSENATKMMVCPDLDEPFIPDSEGLINRIDEYSEMIREFLLHLPDSFPQTGETKNCLGSALQVALKLIGSTGGRITVFNTCLPNVGCGSLQMREEPSDRNSVDVKCLGPAIDFYKTLSLECSAQQVAVDLFIMNSQYCDIATLSGISRFSSGFVYHYPDFYCPPPQTEAMDEGCSNMAAPQRTEASIEVERFKRDFDRYLTRRIGFEAVMRIRCTKGLNIQTFHGSFFIRTTDLMALANLNPDAGYAFQLDLSESLEQFSSVCCQVAALYTSSRGDRRIRVHTMCLPVVSSLPDVFQGADQGAIACLIAKMAVDRVISSGLSYAREAITVAVVDVLCAYASANGLTPAASITSYSMACPPSLRLLALYICGMLRYTAFRVGTQIRVDERAAALERIKCAPIDDVLALCYPSLYAIHPLVTKPVASEHLTLAQKAAALRLSDYGDAHLEADQASDECDSSASSESSVALHESSQLPGQLHLSVRSITKDGVFLFDTGDMLYLLVGSGSSETLNELLGISSPSDLPESGGPFALPFSTKNRPRNAEIPIARRRLMALINLIRLRRPIGTALMCVRHDAPMPVRARLWSAFVEDRTEYAPSYHEFLQMVQGLMKS